MPAVQGRAAGFIARLYYVATPVPAADRTEVGIEAAAIVGNQVIDVSSMGALLKQRTIIDIPVYGQDVAGKLPGQADPGTFDFTVTMNFNDTTHVALRDDAGTGRHSFIVGFQQNTMDITYALFDGFVANADVNQGIDGAITMDVSIARDGAITWVDNS